jgi:hypothetical protein
MLAVGGVLILSSIVLLSGVVPDHRLAGVLTAVCAVTAFATARLMRRIAGADLGGPSDEESGSPSRFRMAFSSIVVAPTMMVAVFGYALGGGGIAVIFGLAAFVAVWMGATMNLKPMNQSPILHPWSRRRRPK